MGTDVPVIHSEIVLTVPGTPAPKGSLRCARNKQHSLYEDNPATKPWRTKIAEAAGKIRQTADRNQPIDLEITFTFDRPKTTKRDYPAVKPDVDKLVRTILDALEDAGVLINDSQVTDLTTRKRYVTPVDWTGDRTPPPDDALPYPGVRIRINPLS